MFRLFLILSTGLSTLCALPTTAFGSEPVERAAGQNKPKLPVFDIALPLILDGQYLGDLAVKIDNDDVSVEVERLTELVDPIMTEQAIEVINASTEKGRIFVNRIDVDGFEFSYNAELLQIEIRSRLSAQQYREISLAPGRPQRFKKTERPAMASLFVTPSISLNYDWNDTDNRSAGLQPVNGLIDIGGPIGREKGVALFSRQRFSSQDGWSLNRSETHLIYDDLDRVVRARAGDVVGRGESFQSVPSIAGISFERYFDYTPQRIIRPVGRTLFDLEQDSTVEILINGISRRITELESGRYNLNDLTLTQGRNNIEVLITDETGQKQIISQNNFFDFGLLEKGLSDFYVSAGVKSSRGNNGIQYSGEPAFTGFYRRGLSKTLTSSVNLQADQYGANGGLTALWASGFGSIRLEGAFSHYQGLGSGSAFGLNYRLDKQIGKNVSGSLSLDSRFQEGRYASVSSASGGFDNIVLNAEDELSYSINANMSGDNWSASAFVGSRQISGRPESINAGLGGSYRVNPDISLSLFARHTDNGNEPAEQRIIAQVSWKMGSKTQSLAKFDTRENEVEVSYRHTASPNVGGLSYRLGSARGFNDNSSRVFGTANYTGNRFLASARHNLSRDGNTLQSTRLNLSSSLVFADGNFGIAQPVRNNFALMSPHKSLAGKTIRLDPNSDGYAGKSDLLGPPVAVRLTPFDSRITYIDVDDLPVGYNFGSGGYSTKPFLYSGYNFKIGSGAFYSAIGQVVDKESGEPIRYLGARFESLDDPEAEHVPAFTNRNGRLAVTGLKAGKYKLVFLTDNKFSKIVEIEEADETLINMGVIDIEK